MSTFCPFENHRFISIVLTVEDGKSGELFLLPILPYLNKVEIDSMKGECIRKFDIIAKEPLIHPPRNHTRYPLDCVELYSELDCLR